MNFFALNPKFWAKKTRRSHSKMRYTTKELYCTLGARLSIGWTPYFPLRRKFRCIRFDLNHVKTVFLDNGTCWVLAGGLPRYRYKVSAFKSTAGSAKRLKLFVIPIVFEALLDPDLDLYMDPMQQWLLNELAKVKSSFAFVVLCCCRSLPKGDI